VVATLAALSVTACSPTAPPGVDRQVLDEAVSRAVGDANTCVLIADAKSGRLQYRYNTLTTCARELPACDRPELTKVDDLLDRAPKGPVTLSCDTLADGSRGVGWAAGPIEGTGLVYAAVMEGERAFPGLMMADRLAGAFRRAGVAKPVSE
jgi:hypothetical protein